MKQTNYQVPLAAAVAVGNIGYNYFFGNKTGKSLYL